MQIAEQSDFTADLREDLLHHDPLLACLVEEGFLERAAPSKLYRLGMEAMQLGLMSAGMAPVVDRFRPVMQRVARQSGDTVFLIVRSGDHALCLHREEGPYPVKAFVVVEDGFALEEDAVIEHCAAHLARYKCPQKVNFVEELPQNLAGKVLRRALR